MAVTFTKANVSKMATILEGDYETVEEAARAALNGAMEIIESRAKFTVVGQVKRHDNKGDKVALGWYGTETQATSAAMGLAFSTKTNEEHFAWVLPVHHGTPDSYYKDRKANIGLSEMAAREAESRKRQAWYEAHPGERLPADWGVNLSHQPKGEVA